MSDQAPEGWSAHDLGNLAKKIEGGGTPPRLNPTYWNGTIPWATVKDLRGISLNSTEELITQDGLDNSTSKLIPANTIVIATRMAVGKAVYFDRSVAINQDLKAFYPKKDLYWRFLLHWYLFHSEQIAAMATGSTVKGIRLEVLSSFPINLPPLPEQQKIATILSSVDDVIEKTRAQIDKLKDLKTGMMQELLTKGIGHTEFKDSPVGRIPAEWEIARLGALASFVTSGSRGWAKYYSKSGAIFIRIGNLTREHINLRFDDTVYVNPPESAEGKRTQVLVGDVLISITADLGIIGVINETLGEAYVNQHVSLVRLNEPEQVRWVGHFLAFDGSQKQFVASNDAGAKAGLNLPAIRNMMIALPRKEEREKIVFTLDSIDHAIAKERMKSQQIASLKKALMQDLLTGKVRVSIDSQEVAVA